MAETRASLLPVKRRGTGATDGTIWELMGFKTVPWERASFERLTKLLGGKNEHGQKQIKRFFYYQ